MGVSVSLDKWRVGFRPFYRVVERYQDRFSEWCFRTAREPCNFYEEDEAQARKVYLTKFAAEHGKTGYTYSVVPVRSEEEELITRGLFYYLPGDDNPHRRSI